MINKTKKIIQNRQKLKDDVYSKIALQLCRLSKDENTQIGSIIVGKDGSPISWGYNGSVSGFDDSLIPYSREIKKLSYVMINPQTGKKEKIVFESNKYPFMLHAESNAISYAKSKEFEGSTLYVTGLPCERCALEIARAKIARVVIVAEGSKNISAGTMINDTMKNNTLFIFSNANIELIMNDVIVLPIKRKKIKKI